MRSPLTEAAEKPALFVVSVHKYVVMSLCTLGVYSFVWIYANWKALNRRDAVGASPFWRTTFAGVWNFDLLRRIKGAAELEGGRVSWEPAVLGIVYLTVSFAWCLPDPWSWLNLATPLCVVPAVATIRRMPSSHGREARYTVWNLVAMLIGLGLFGLFLLVRSAISDLGLEQLDF